MLNSTSQNTRNHRSMHLENLEERQLLSSTPWQSGVEQVPAEVILETASSSTLSEVDYTIPVTSSEITVPSMYNTNDYTKIYQFLELTDAKGVKNGMKLNASYTATDVNTWTGVSWTEVDGKLCISRISWENLTAENILDGLLDLSNCSSLKTLKCTGYELMGLDVSGCSALLDLDVTNNQLVQLHLSDCTELNYLSCANNNLTTLEISGCTKLTHLRCENNQLDSLYLTACPELIELACSSQLLEQITFHSNHVENQLKLINTDGTDWTIYDTDSNKITVTNDEYRLSAGAHHLVTTNNVGVSRTISFIFYHPGEIHNLQQFLTHMDDTGLTNGAKLNSRFNINDPQTWDGIRWEKVDNIIHISEIDWSGTGLTGTLNLSDSMRLQSLDCSNNQIKTLSLSNCANLATLSCNGNLSLSTLNVSGTAITLLSLASCSNMDTLNASSCLKLEAFDSDSCTIAELNLSDCMALTTFDYSNCQIQTLNLSRCRSLTSLYYTDDQTLTRLNLSSCSSLTTIDCSNNALTELNVTGCSMLQDLYCSNNQLIALELAGCNSLSELVCYSETLRTVYLSRMNQTTIFLEDSNNTWTFKDKDGNTIATESDCFFYSEKMVATNEEGQTIEFIYQEDQYNPSDLQLLRTFLAQTNENGLSNGELITPNFDINSPATWAGITWTYIDGCHYLTDINWKGCELTGVLDLSECVTLERIDCSLNQLEELILSGCTSLTEIDCSDNDLMESLNVSDCTALEYLICSLPNLLELDVTGCTNLIQLECILTRLSSLDISTCDSLVSLNCSQNEELASLLVANCAMLQVLDCSDCALTELNVSGCSSLVALNKEGNQLTTLNAANCVSLSMLQIYEFEKLASLNINGCTSLKMLECLGNVALTSINAEGCTSLTTLECSYNALTDLNLAGCIALETLNCVGNQFTMLDLSQNSAIKELACYSSVLVAVILPENGKQNPVVNLNYDSDSTWVFSDRDGNVQGTTRNGIYTITTLPITATSADQSHMIFFGTTQPLFLEGVTLSSQSANIGDSLTVTTKPSTATVTYQWYRRSVIDGEFVAIEGATSATYQTTDADSNRYLKCIVTGTDDYVGHISTSTVYVKNVQTWGELALFSNFNESASNQFTLSASVIFDAVLGGPLTMDIHFNPDEVEFMGSVPENAGRITVSVTSAADISQKLSELGFQLKNGISTTTMSVELKDATKFDTLKDFIRISSTPSEFKTVSTTQNHQLGSHAFTADMPYVNEWNNFNLEIWTSSFQNRNFEISYDSTIYTLDFATCEALPDFGLTFNQVTTQNGQTTLSVGVVGKNTDVAVSENTLVAVLRFKPASHKGGISAGEYVERIVSVDDVTQTTKAYSVAYDLNNSGEVDINDLVIFARYFGTTAGNNPNSYYTEAWKSDFNSSGGIEINDLVFFAQNYGNKPASANSVSYPLNYKPGQPVRPVTVFATENNEMENILKPVSSNVDSRIPTTLAVTETNAQVINVTDFAISSYFDEKDEEEQKLEEKRLEDWKKWG
ncbi:MAG: hypothetical protein Q4C70_03765 [Planctomycetia bacterium]|nr:hypothetical protein [Planctomycetia bacterium]